MCVFKSGRANIGLIKKEIILKKRVSLGFRVKRMGWWAEMLF